MSVKLLTKHHLKFLSLKGGCTGPSESTLVKMPHCWKSDVVAHMFVLPILSIISLEQCLKSMRLFYDAARIAENMKHVHTSTCNINLYIGASGRPQPLGVMVLTLLQTGILPNPI